MKSLKILAALAFTVAGLRAQSSGPAPYVTPQMGDIIQVQRFTQGGQSIYPSTTLQAIATLFYGGSLGYAPLISPIFGGNPQAPTPANGDNSFSIATTAFVHANGGSYTLPTATTTVLGGVKVDGTTVTISNGTISAAGGSGVASARAITQSNSFTVGECVYNNNGTWTASSNAALSSSYVDGVVTVASGSAFTVVMGGYENTITGLSSSTQYYLGTGGALTSTAPVSTTAFLVTVLRTGVAGDGVIEIGSPAALALLTNAALANPSVTIGTTSVSLGATVTSFSGVTLASPTFTGTSTGVTPSNGDNSTQLATTAWVDANTVSAASPAFTGTPTAPTATVGTNTTQLATTAFVLANASGGGFPITIGSTSVASGSTTSTIAGLTLNGVTVTGSVTGSTALTLSSGASNQNLNLAINGSVKAEVFQTGGFEAGTGTASGGSWGATGILLASVGSSTITDTSATGTRAITAMNSFGMPTVTSSSADTYTDIANVYVAGSVAQGTNSTFTNSSAIYVAAGAGAGTNTYGLKVLNQTGGSSHNYAALLGTNGSPFTNMRDGISGAMSGGTVTVADTATTANTRYLFSTETLGTVTVPSSYMATTRTAGTSFVITSNQATETGTVHWYAWEP